MVSDKEEGAFCWNMFENDEGEAEVIDELEKEEEGFLFCMRNERKGDCDDGENERDRSEGWKKSASDFPEWIEIGCVLMSEKDEVGGFKDDENEEEDEEVVVVVVDGCKGAGEDSDRNERKDDEGSTLSGALEWLVLLGRPEIEAGAGEEEDEEDVDNEERDEESEVLLETTG